MSKGFTLPETMISLAILGLASGTIITIFSESLYRIRHSEHVVLANALAQSLVARVEAGEIALQPNNAPFGGADGGFSWKIETQPYGDAQDRNAWAADPQKVVVSVSWDDRRDKDTIALSTIILLPSASPESEE